MSDDDDDPVVEEIPVFLTHSLAEQLYVFQYPVVPCTNPGHFNVIKSRIKPENEEVTLELGLDLSSSTFDRSHGELIASTVDKDKPSDKRLFSRKVMDKILLESSQVQPTDINSYGIGMMHGRELHISPVKSIISLGPPFKHLNNQDEDESEGSEEPRPVRTDSRRLSYSAYTQKIAHESWCNTEYYDPNTPKAQAERSRLSCCEVRSNVNLSKEGWELTKKANKIEVSDHRIVSSAGSDAILKVIASLTSPLTLKQLTSVLGLKGESATQLLSRILPHMVLVQGYFLPRSDLIYSPDSISQINGIPGEFMSRARDYVLYHLNEGKALNRRSLAEVVRLPREEINDILEPVAMKSEGSWVFKFSTNHDFISRYSHIFEQQRLLWEARIKQVKENFTSTSGGQPQPGSSSSRSPRKRRESTTSESSTSRSSKGNKNS